MKKGRLLLSLAFATSLVTVNPAAAQPPRSDVSNPQASGGYNLNVHTHSADDPMFSELLFETQRLPFDFGEGDTFSYASRQCELPARFNDVGLDFRPDYPGVDDDGSARVRHRAQGTITQVSGDRGTIVGTITTVLCEDPLGGTETEHVIVHHFVAKYRQVSDDEVRLRGRFEISPTESTGTFENLKGHGSIKASLTCLREATCAELGHFTDFVAPPPPSELDPQRAGLVGSYKDRDVTI